jgi:hypothetical protein
MISSIQKVVFSCLMIVGPPTLLAATAQAPADVSSPVVSDPVALAVVVNAATVDGSRSTQGEKAAESFSDCASIVLFRGSSSDCEQAILFGEGTPNAGKWLLN